MARENLSEPVLIVRDGEYLVVVGKPTEFKPKELAVYARKGYSIETITIGDYREKIKAWKWIYDKPNS